MLKFILGYTIQQTILLKAWKNRHPVDSAILPLYNRPHNCHFEFIEIIELFAIFTGTRIDRVSI
jgi:hypothetical protein